MCHSKSGMSGGKLLTCLSGINANTLISGARMKILGSRSPSLLSSLTQPHFRWHSSPCVPTPSCSSLGFGTSEKTALSLPAREMMWAESVSCTQAWQFVDYPGYLCNHLSLPLDGIFLRFQTSTGPLCIYSQSMNVGWSQSMGQS